MRLSISLLHELRGQLHKKGKKKTVGTKEDDSQAAGLGRTGLCDKVREVLERRAFLH